MLVRLRPTAFIAICAATIAEAGCNVVLGINEPEETLSPPVRYYPWDGYNGDSPVGPDDASSDRGDVGAEARDASFEPSPPPPPPIVDSAAERRSETTTPIIDASTDGPRCFIRVFDGGTRCGVGCGSLCPLRNACGRDADCASSRCYAGLCTMPHCLSKMLDGDETDVDCGGSCAFTCAVGQRCRSVNDCASGWCSAGYCQTRPQDASADAPRDTTRGGDAPVVPDATDAARPSDATSEPDVIGRSEPEPDAAVDIDEADLVIVED